MPHTEILDKNLLEKILGYEASIKKQLEATVTKLKAVDPDGTKLTKEELKTKFKHPLDAEVLKKIKEMQGQDFYKNIPKIRKLWVLLIDKSVRALRFFDEREPYQRILNKVPIASGIDELKEYFEKYADFEGLLYGSNKSYRDHVIHVFRSWLLGLLILLNPRGATEPLFITKIKIEGIDDIELDFFETLSMWTITALCHDLGYPLEKSQKIFQTTNNMLEYFISNPKMAVDLSFSGVQDYMNEHIIRFLSSKMEKRPRDERLEEKERKKEYTGRVQPKYYFKFSKSLEKYYHGIIGAIILYKILVYFLESDLNINEDYYYTKDESKQYYLRREILRAIASHTCYDIYHLNTTTISFLLIICDDLQEWGRKKWINFYSGTSVDDSNITTIESFTETEVSIKEKVENVSNDNIRDAIDIVFNQFERYKKLFRDGLDTSKRLFNFMKTFELFESGTNHYNVVFEIPPDDFASIKVIFKLKDITGDPVYKGLRESYDIGDIDVRTFYLEKRKEKQSKYY